MIRISKWAVLSAALAAAVAFSDNIVRFLGLLNRLPLPDWVALLAPYSPELVSVVVLSALLFSVDWRVARKRYAAFRSLLAGSEMEIRVGSMVVCPEEILLFLSLSAFVASLSYFEFWKARTLYVSYGLGYLVKARCNGDLVAARDRADALAKNRLWGKYSHILLNLKVRYGALDALKSRRLAIFGKYRDDLPSELLQSDAYEIRFLFAADVDAGGRAHETKQPLAKSWLKSPVPCSRPVTAITGRCRAVGILLLIGIPPVLAALPGWKSCWRCGACPM